MVVFFGILSSFDKRSYHRDSLLQKTKVMVDEENTS